MILAILTFQDDTTAEWSLEVREILNTQRKAMTAPSGGRWVPSAGSLWLYGGPGVDQSLPG